MSAFEMSIRLDVPLDEALERARTALAEQGFGILSEIDVAATLKAKLGVEVAPQVIPRRLQRAAGPGGPADRARPRTVAAVQCRRPGRRGRSDAGVHA